jgi:sodium-dependent dicarboxylate transporter 2/3/5
MTAHVEGEEHGAHGIVARVGRAAGPALGIALTLWMHPAAGAASSLPGEAAIAAGLLVWMATWWVTQAVDLAVTAMLPAALLPVLGVMPFKDVAASYADNVIFLFAGGSVIAIALDRHGVSSHFVHWLLSAAGTRPALVVTALFAAATAVSAFVSNTATTALMLPLAIGVAASAIPRAGALPAVAAASARNFTCAVLLAIAYGSTVGGGATLIGSPPNAIAANFLRAEGVEIDFLGWARIGTPIALAVSPVVVLVLTRMLPTHGVVLARRGRDSLPPLGFPGWATLAVFGVAVLVWTTSSAWPDGWRPEGLTDGGVAIAAAVLLMVLPAGRGRATRIVPWACTRDLPWGVFLLFGGGLAIGDAMQRTGLSTAIGELFAGLGALPGPLVLGTIVVSLAFASEIGSNTALTATAVPILGAVAPALGMPVEKVAIATAFGASYAFMLPVGTPPNALVFGTGKVPHGTMVRVGLVLNLCVAAVVTAMLWLLM